VQSDDAVGPLVREAGSEHIAEEVVVPVPLSAIVEGDEEQVRPLEGFEGGPGVAAARHCGAQRRGQAVQDRALQQERPDIVALAVQDLVDEVVDDEAVVAGELGDERRRVVPALQGQGGKLQGGDPPFGPGFEGVHVRCGEIQCHRVVQVGRRLLRGEAEIGRTDLQELASSPQAGERPRWVRPAGDDEVQLFREVLDQEEHRLLHVEGLDEVVVVQHQDDIAGERSEVVQQTGDDRFQRCRGGLQPAQCVGSDVGSDLSHGGDDIGPEHRRVAVAPVERQPRRRLHLLIVGGEPLGEQRGLAEAGRGGHEHDGRKGATIEALVQPGPLDHTPSPPRDMQLALEQENPGRAHRPVAYPVAGLRLGATRTWIRSPSRPRMLRISTGRSPAGPNQCRTWVSNSATSAGCTVMS